MSEFKIPPYLYFYPNDWLNDPEVRRLPGDVKGFYIDMICLFHKSFPYGYCSLINPMKTKKLQKQVNQEANQEVNLMVELLLTLSVADQLKLAENLEPELHKYLPYSQEQISGYIRVLEDRMVISRSYGGVVYVRRMVKDFKRRVTAYLNGSKGGNPGVKGRKSTSKKRIPSGTKILKHSSSRKQVNQNANPKDNSLLTYSNNNTEGREKGGTGGKNHPIFQMQEIYDQTFNELNEKHYSKKLTEKGLEQWKKFVDWVIEMNFTDLFITKFIQPPDFQVLYENGFTENKWEPVVRKILSTGVEPKHNLYWRIPDFEKIVAQKEGWNKPGNAVITKKKDYGNMRT